MYLADDVVPKTGFFKIDREAAGTSSPIKIVVKNPVQGGPQRTISFDSSRPSYFQDIDRAYRIDSFVRQGVDKYAEAVVLNGWYLDGESDRAVEYLYYRLRLMHLAHPQAAIDILISDIARDLVKYGNAFLVKARTKVPNPIPGLNLRGMNGNPIGAYFRIDPLMIQPVVDREGNLTGWAHGSGLSFGSSINTKTFSLDDVIHIFYCRPAGAIWGESFLAPVLEDVRNYRQMEEMVLRLMYKHLNPLIHQEVPDTTGTGLGRQEDVDAAARAHQVMAPDGFIITPPGHKITVIGAESHALRAEGYLKIMRQRIYAGLGLTGLQMGEATTVSTGSADAVRSFMYDRVKFYQLILSYALTTYMLNELLFEGGFDPLSRPEDIVVWQWNEVDESIRRANENHAVVMYQSNLLTEDEARRRIRLRPMTPDQDSRRYINRVQLALALARRVGDVSALDISSGTNTNK